MKVASIVIAVYYSEQSLPPLFRELTRVEGLLAKRDVKLELIFVDDGSGDGSLRELLKIKEARPPTKVVKLTRNFGAVQASKTGTRFVTGDCYMVLAADLQDPPELILEMVDRWLAGAKYVVCARQARKDPVTTKIFAYLYYRLVRVFVMKDYPRHGYDLALMDRVMIPHMQQSGKNTNPLLFSHWLGFKPEIIRYTRKARAHGTSRWTVSKKVKFFLDSLLGFSIFPIRMISLVGSVIGVSSFGYGLWIIVNAMLGRTEVRGFATIITLIAFLMSLIILMLGVIGEYLWRIFDELSRKPEAVIEEVY